MRDLSRSWSFSGIDSSCARWDGITRSHSSSVGDDEELAESNIPSSLISPSDASWVDSDGTNEKVCPVGIFLAS